MWHMFRYELSNAVIQGDGEGHFSFKRWRVKGVFHQLSAALPLSLEFKA